MTKKEKIKKRSGIVIYIILFISLILLYSRYIEPYNLTIHEYKIKNSLLPKNFDGLKIVHFSDVHYGRTVDKKYLDKIVEKINNQNPDIVIFTGDFLDKDVKINDKELEDVKKSLSKIKSKIGNYAVNGNHDMADINTFNNIMDSNFTILNNEEELIYFEDDTPISLVGLTDLSETKIDYSVFDKENKYFRIVLAHEPDTLENIKNNDINVMLAGHSHGGQVRFPFIGPIIIPTGAKKYYNFYYKEDETELFVSNGIGTSTINFRFLSRPSINLYRFYN